MAVSVSREVAIPTSVTCQVKVTRRSTRLIANLLARRSPPASARVSELPRASLLREGANWPVVVPRDSKTNSGLSPSSYKARPRISWKYLCTSSTRSSDSRRLFAAAERGSALCHKGLACPVNSARTDVCRWMTSEPGGHTSGLGGPHRAAMSSSADLPCTTASAT